MSNDKRLYRLLKSKKIAVGKAEDGTYLCSIPHNGNKEIFNITSSNFRIAFKSFWKKEYGELLNDKEVQEIISIIEVECYESKNKIQRNHRIYTKGRMLIYQLNTDNNTRESSSVESVGQPKNGNVNKKEDIQKPTESKETTESSSVESVGQPENDNVNKKEDIQKPTESSAAAEAERMVQ